MGDDIGVTDVREWVAGLDEVAGLIGPRFARSEPRRNAVAYLRGLLSERERKNSWTLSEQAGQRTPDPMQRLLSTPGWDPDLARDDLCSYVVQHLGDRAGVLIVDETGDRDRCDRARPRLPHRHPVKKGVRGDDGGLVRLSLPEIRHLIAALVLHAPADPVRVLHRSRWRRKHQHTARRHHYLRRGHTP